ncbi:MaoC/PaaZ C-terminal domain-containing protein [Bacillus sp. DTU_2020_1000418_1_SI_GHA_SEK_038]|uniref:MaoC/PaaZ C-terminal domain-containing protein n=1 Tax=Bacillus sp. DTU_2020_1000418_1_SI_GHA_SEK_038 TaxID=3077585 RepID=UPI0028F0E1BE|nr:MaoC/PaaZ C-terminal domain-containing protein [Bacillus sp. DTU_2020_1000418_1_SI_GHA_SEK_038]WNS76172.1 MaoC/PaaZ C-terminal domain-containing protein [Bacillus sp. DTU_2020_1000418_1_SI_GHA_SEK_038]
MNFNEITVGRKFETASYKVSKEDIISFASQFDPQYMHINEEKAKQSRFGGIIASGLHTLSISFKLWVELDVLGDHVIAGTGVNNLKFTKPVYPDDVIYVITEVIRKKEAKTAGEVTLLLSSFKNDGELVLQAEISALISK